MSSSCLSFSSALLFGVSSFFWFGVCWFVLLVSSLVVAFFVFSQRDPLWKVLDSCSRLVLVCCLGVSPGWLVIRGFSLLLFESCPFCLAFLLF